MYGREVYSFCKQLTCNKQEADDLYQDTFLKAIEQLNKLEEENNVKSYLLGISIRLWSNKRRKMAWRNRIAPTENLVEDWESDIDSSPVETPEDSCITKEKTRIVQIAVNKLPKQLRICILLFYMESLSIRQISDVLHIPQGTVKNRLYQARKKLEKELEDVL